MKDQQNHENGQSPNCCCFGLTGSRAIHHPTSGGARSFQVRVLPDLVASKQPQLIY